MKWNEAKELLKEMFSGDAALPPEEDDNDDAELL